MLSPQNDTNEIITETLQELITDHDEADTFLLLHANPALTAFSSIVSKTPNTDVFLLYLAQQHELSGNSY